MKRKHIIIGSIAISIIVIMSIFLICFFTIPRITYSYDHETDTYYVDKVYGDASYYTIKDTVGDKPVTKIKERAFMNHQNLTEIDFGKNLIEIERMAFLNCKKLEKIDLSFVEVIGRNAFENCIHLKEVHLTLKDISGGMFMGCTQLEIVELTNTLSIGSYAFSLTSIREIMIPRSCSLVGEEAFYGCFNLTKIIVKSYDLRNNSYLKALKGVEFQLN